MRTLLRPLIGSFVTLTILTGVVYPLLVTGIAQWIFPRQANGSLIQVDDRAIGSELVGQFFSEAKFFWGRPSATLPFAYNAAASAGSNLGPTNPALAEAVRVRSEALRSADPTNDLPIPIDLVTASASGLDPHISVAAALYQVPRVARERGLNEEQLRLLVEQYTTGRQLGFLGEPRVNVLQLNLALEGLQ